MSTNCIVCIKNERTDTDLMCDDCRKKERGKRFVEKLIKVDFTDEPYFKLKCHKCGTNYFEIELGSKDPTDIIGTTCGSCGKYFDLQEAIDKKKGA